MPTRIITKNLLASAWNALEPQMKGPVFMSNIEDLCTLLDLFALHDSVLTLGNPTEKTNEKPELKEIYDYLQHLGLTIEFDQTPELVDLAEVRLRSFLEQQGVPDKALDAEGMRKQLEYSLNPLLFGGVDYLSDFQEGASQYSADSDSLAAAFFLRTFAYWALASTRETIPLVPDAARSWGLPKLGPRARDDFEQVHSVISGKYWDKTSELLPGNGRLASFPAAVVILKQIHDAGETRNRKSAILEYAAEIRGKLKKAREFISDTAMFREWRFVDENGLTSLNPGAHDPRSFDEVEAEFQKALGELRDINIPLPKIWYDIRPVWEVGEGFVENVHNFTDIANPIKAPFKVAGAVGKSIELVKKGKTLGKPPSRVGDLMEIHCVIGGGLWGAKNEIDLERIFGKIADDRRDPLRLRKLWDK